LLNQTVNKVKDWSGRCDFLDAKARRMHTLRFTESEHVGVEIYKTSWEHYNKKPIEKTKKIGSLSLKERLPIFLCMV